MKPERSRFELLHRIAELEARLASCDEVIPEPSLTIVLEKYRQAVEQKAIVSWEEIGEYPTARLTGEVTVSPVFDNQGACTTWWDQFTT